MGMFGRFRRKRKEPDLVQNLLNLRIKISQLPKKYPVGQYIPFDDEIIEDIEKGESIFRTNMRKTKELIPEISMKIDHAIKALKTGFDPNNNSITEPLIAHGLNDLIEATRKPGFTGLLWSVLNADGIQVFKRYINELEQISNRISSFGRFIAYDNGIVKDTITGLEWYAGPDKDMTRAEAESWVKNLYVAGSGWRMPTIKELGTLYEKDSFDIMGRNLTPLLKTTTVNVWGKSTGSPCFFSFDAGHAQPGSLGSDGKYMRAFAVRSRK